MLGSFQRQSRLATARRAQVFFVVKKDHSAILGLETSEKLGIVQRAVDCVTTSNTETIVKEFPRLFHGTGRAPREYKIALHKDAVPVVQPARRVPLSLREPLRTELGRMEKEGIIQKVSSPTDWDSRQLQTRVTSRSMPSRSFQHSASPVEDGRSPGELLQGRRLRTPLPDFNPMSATVVKKHQQRSYHRRTLPDLSNNDAVRLSGTWWARKAKVVGSAGPRSFYVRTENNTVLRRNRRHLLATKESYEVGSSDDEDMTDNQTPFQGVASTTTAASPVVAQQPSPRPLRRSQRQTRQPERLGYDQRFQQTSQRH
ncbi:uncharacterized protein [Dermacentor albipictus]|uniref:uncharacterized protein n=1 Tax=Dermacentor albipictus TaxID=60249 RepID=UPI0031FC92EF